MTTTANTQSAEKIHLIQATTTPDGEVKFVLPIKPELVQSVEAIDLDLMLVSSSGEKYILQQGALLATTNSESKLVFSNGDAMSAADQIKRIGVLKPVEGGSFRLASALTPEAADKLTGNEFGLGKDAEDMVQKVEKILQSLEAAQINDSQSSISFSEASNKYSARQMTVDPLASPLSGMPPSSKDDTAKDINIVISQTQRLIKGATEFQISELHTLDGKALSNTSATNILPIAPLQVVASSNKFSIDKNGFIQSSLQLPGVSNATQLELTLIDKSQVVTLSNLGIAFQQNGKDITLADGKLIFNITGANDVLLGLTWKPNLADAKIQFNVKYLDASGQGLATSFVKPITLSYQNLLTSGDFNQIDEHGNRVLVLAKNGYAYEIDLTSQTAASVTGGQGDEVFLLDKLPDKLDGGSGVNTVDFQKSSSAIQIDLDNNIFAQIQKFIGSSYNDTLKKSTHTISFNGGGGEDTFDYSGAKNAITLDISNPLNNNGAAKGDTFSFVEKFVGTQFNDYFFSSSGSFKIDGGDGSDDRVNYGSLKAGITVTQVDGEFSVAKSSGFGYDHLSNIEGLIGTGYDDTINGTTKNNFLRGLGGDDILQGNEGNDTLYGDDGNDSLSGGAGDDLLFAGAGSDVLQGDAGNDVFSLNQSELIGKTIDGGSDSDTVKLTGLSANLKIDLTSIMSNYKNIENLGIESPSLNISMTKKLVSDLLRDSSDTTLNLVISKTSTLTLESTSYTYQAETTPSSGIYIPTDSQYLLHVSYV